MQLGEIRDNLVTGKIIEVHNDDLYIDFGGKFNCVVKRPSKDGELYTRHARVRLRLHDWEMSSSFLGTEKAITLLEADCTLVGLVKAKQSDVRD